MLRLVRRLLVATVMILLEKLSTLKQIVSLYISNSITMPRVADKSKKKSCRWLPTSSEQLDQAEEKIFSYLRSPFKTYYVDIGPKWNLDQVQIWTLEAKHNFDENGLEIATTDLSSTSNSPDLLPLVLLHGFASGIALWSLNLDKLSLHGKRHVYAFDMMGFAKSSRPTYTFPKFKGSTKERKEEEAKVMEEYMVESIEKWRAAVGGPLNGKFVLLGHSFGGYLATAYTLRHPDHVAHLILADPWGFPVDTQTAERPESGKLTSLKQIPTWMRLTAHFFIDVLHPLSILRAFGPWGPKIFSNARSDLKKKFQKLEDDFHRANGSSPASLANSSESSDSTSQTGSEEQEKQQENNMIMDYIYHCNVQTPPSGEVSFKKMCTTAWPRRPMIERVAHLDPRIKLDFILGGNSWINNETGHEVKELLEKSENEIASRKHRVNVNIIPGASHHVYADNPDEFNRIVLEACEVADVDNHGLVAHQQDVANGNVVTNNNEGEKEEINERLINGIVNGYAEINLAKVEA